MKIFAKIICFFKKHAEPEKYITETEYTIRTKRCSRCKIPLGMGNFKNIPPPNVEIQTKNN